MESRVTAIETQLVYMESRMDATDTAASENQIEMDNVRQELYQQNEAFMVQTRDLLNRYGEQQLLLQRLSETCARIELQLEKSQLIINSPTQFSVATPVRAQDQSVDLLDLPMPTTSSISIPAASTNPTTRQWEADNRPIQQIPQPAFLNTSSAQAAQWSPSPTAASQPQQQVRMPDARYMAPEMLHGGVLQPQPANHMNHFSAHETNYATFTNVQGHSTGQADVQQQMRNVMCHSNFRVCQRPNHQLFNFDGKVVNFKLWRNKMLDHLANRSTPTYKSVIAQIEAHTNPILQANLENAYIDNVNAWEVATALDGFIFDHVDTDLYERRSQLCGSEDGNGFEAWRQIFLEHSGGGSLQTLGGFRRLIEYPRCERLNGLQKHLADWEELVKKYGKNLMTCPGELRAMVLGIIPSDMETELMPKDVEYPTWQTIIAFCRKTTIYLRHKELSDQVRNPKPPTRGLGHKVNSFTADDTSSHNEASQPTATVPLSADGGIPTMMDFINAVKQLNGKGSGKGGGKGDGGRRTNSSGRDAAGGAKKRFIFKGCFECGSEDHQIKDCAERKRIIGADGKPPTGHKTARDKAWEKFKAKNPRKPRVNMFEGEQPDTESEDEDFDPLAFSFVSHGTSWTQAHQAPTEQITPTINAFTALETDDNDSEVDNALEQLNGWAHRVHVMKQRSSQKSRAASSRKPKARALITCEADLDAVDKKIIASLPRTGKAMAAAMKKCPSNDLLEAGEVWVMLDSGANIDAADIEEHFKDYVPFIDANPDSKNAESACGGVVKNWGSAQCVVPSMAKTRVLGSPI
jgi:hypothetical protein